MSRSIVFTSFAAALLAAASALAQAPAGAPAGATGACKDGSYTNAASKKGACRGHKGVQDWYAAASAGSAAAAAPATASAPTNTGSKKKHGSKSTSAGVAPAASVAPATAAPAAASPMPAPAAPASVATTKSSHAPAVTAAPGGGAGLVWANKDSKVYHCQGDRWYGKTKEGAYLSEADARSQGYRPDHGKGCQN